MSDKNESFSQRTDGTTEAFLRDYLERERENGNHEPHPVLAELDDDVARSAVAKVISAYDHGVATDYSEFEETPLYSLLKGHESSLTMAQDVEDGRASRNAFREGVSNDSMDMSAFRVIEELESLWRDYPTFQVFLYGPKPPEGPVGVGKTDLAYLLSEIGERVHDDLSVASNNETDEFDTLQSWSEVEEWLKSTDGEKLFIMDEAAQVLQFADMRAGKVVSKLLKLLRKYHGNIIFIGHTGRDIPRDVRRQLLVCRKESKKKATIGVGLTEDSESIVVEDVMMRLTGIPETRVSYDTLDEGEFTFDIDDDDDAGDDDDEEEETVTCREPDCGCTSDQYPTIHKNGYCPYHGPDDEQDDTDEAQSDPVPDTTGVEDADDLLDTLAERTGQDRGDVERAVVDALADAHDQPDDAVDQKEE